MQTERIYLNHMFLYEDHATITAVHQIDGKIALELDRSIFYPQGGGQPFDVGFIEAQDGSVKMVVEEVRAQGEQILHKGTMLVGEFKPGMKVITKIDNHRRILNSRIHTAGHLIDIALEKCGVTFVPTKGYHFPEGAYVEYNGTLEEADRAKLHDCLQREAFELLNQNLPILIKTVDYATFSNMVKHVPEYLARDKPVRIMIIEGYEPFACGGTHVASTAQVGELLIDKIKNNKGFLRVSYSVN
jgi:Ser-tRNA(Ala) deacylase AlaX